MFKSNLLAFDIETVADVAGYRRIHGISGGSDEEIHQLMVSERRAESGNGFIRPHLQKIVAISVLLHDGHKPRLWSLGEVASDEEELIRRFFAGIEQYVPTLVSWNGGGFDLPVLQYRAMLYDISGRQCLDNGEFNRDFRHNNYLSRYHSRHLDLMDVLACYHLGHAVKLDDYAKLCGLPGKLAMDGAAVPERYFAGQREEIRNYCETDVLNTYLLYLRYARLRGTIDGGQHRALVQQLRDYLGQPEAPAHHREFLEAWQVQGQNP